MSEPLTAILDAINDNDKYKNFGDILNFKKLINLG